MVPRRSLAWACVRSVFLNGLWTIQRGQNLGFLFSLWPVIKKLHARREDRARAARAYLGFFSTHPYTAGVALGVTAGLEEDRVREGGSADSVSTVRTAMAGPLAAIGESFFWGTWFPFSLALTMLIGAFHPRWTLVLVFLGVYNAAHLLARVGGFYLGYRWRAGIVVRLAALRLQRVTLVLAATGMALVAARLVVLAGAEKNMVLGFLWAFFFWGVLRLGVRPSLIAAGTAAASVVYSLTKAGLF